MSLNRRKLEDWTPPDDWSVITTLDDHTEGEPPRIMLEGFPKLKGDTILERRADALEHHDSLRTALMWEPRGHAFADTAIRGRRAAPGCAYQCHWIFQAVYDGNPTTHNRRVTSGG
jgi:proline racemase